MSARVKSGEVEYSLCTFGCAAENGCPGTEALVRMCGNECCMEAGANIWRLAFGGTHDEVDD